MGNSQSISDISTNVSRASERLSDKISGESCNGNINLTIFNKYLSFPVKVMLQLITPGNYDKLAQRGTETVTGFIEDKLSSKWEKIAIDFFLSIAKDKVGSFTNVYRMYVEVGEKSSLKLVIGFTAKEGIQVLTDPAKFTQLLDKCEKGLDGCSSKTINIKAGSTWKYIKAAIQEQKDKVYGILTHNDKDYTDILARRLREGNGK